MSGTLFSNHGLVVVKLGKVLQSYEELKPSVEGLVAGSRRAELLTELLLAARVSSPFLAEPLSATSAAKPSGILPDQDAKVPGLPAPDLKMPGAGQLAPPENQGSKPKELPRPTGTPRT